MINKLRDSISSYFVGKDDIVENLLICMLAKGHVLLEDVPGVGKTTLAKTLAKTAGCSFARIQFTPDTLPSDVVGVSIYNTATGEFEYKESALMKQIILADELNRTSPKTQAALLEAMSEETITVDGTEHLLPTPFMVVATQNPVEFLGTYPLPEAQKDRFMMRLSIGYPGKEDEICMASDYVKGKSVESLAQVCTDKDIIRMQQEVTQVEVSLSIIEYIEDIIGATRQNKDFVYGASPRAMLALIRASSACAYIKGRNFVKPDDVKACAINVLHHRLMLTSDAKIRKESIDKILEGIIIKAKIPMV